MHRARRSAGESGLVVYLHGHAAAPVDLADLGDRLGLGPHWRVVVPATPDHGHAESGSWFESGPRGADRPSLERSAVEMEMVITAVLEESDLSRSALVLAGFSQGAAMAMVLAARGAARGGRLIVSSGWIPEGPGIDIDLADCGVASALVQLSSGDEVVAPELTRWSADALERSGCVVDVVEYPGPHDMTELRYRDAGAWMTSR